jgi:uncharacterized protein (DUF4213/DUF364 family)
MSIDNGSPAAGPGPRERSSTLEKVKALFREIAEREGMLNVEISVLAKPLTPEEAIGTPGRRDYPIILGKERVIEASVLGSKGHAFTDSPRDFLGTLGDVLELDLDTNRSRAVFIATLNAALRSLGMVGGTVHCKDEDPEKCAREIAEIVSVKHGKTKVGLIGLNPAIAERLTEAFGSDRVFITDLNPDNIGTRRFGVEIWDGAHRTADLVEAADVIILTGTTLVNGTFDAILSLVRDLGKEYLVYGVTTAGVSELLGFERVCPYGRDG